MNILVLSKDLNFSVTGGQKINKHIYDLLERDGHVISFCQRQHPTKSNWSYLFSLLLHLFEYLRYDKIIIDSSSFPKTLWFVLMTRFLGKREKIIITLHHYIYEDLSGIKGFIYKQLETTFVKQCGEAIIFSPYVVDLSKKYINPKRVRYVGLPFERVNNQCDKHERRRLLYVGTIERRKGLIYLIEALSLIPPKFKKELRLDVVGKIADNEYFETLIESIKEYGIEDMVHFKGRVSDDELRSLYSHATVFSFPSLYEGFGMVIVEAMSYGLPVVAFNNSAIPYTVKTDVNGIVVKNKDAHSFCDAVVKILEDKTYYQKVADGARRTYEQSKSYEEFDKDVTRIFSANI